MAIQTTKIERRISIGATIAVVILLVALPLKMLIIAEICMAIIIGLCLLSLAYHPTK